MPSMPEFSFSPAPSARLPVPGGRIGVMRVGILAGAACAILLGACSSADIPWADVDTRPQAGMPEAALRPISAEAVRLGDDLLMVPNTPDADGCDTWRMASQSKATLKAVFFRDAEGNFTTDRRRAACRAR